MKDRRHRRGMRLSVEQVEGRALLSGASAALAGSVAHKAAHVHVKAGPAGLPVTPSGSQSPTPGQGPGNATEFFNPTGNRTPHEVAREQYLATYTGTYVIGRGRFDSQSRMLTFHGAGTSTVALHSDAQLGIVTPKDTNQPLSGLLTMLDRNNNTNFIYGVDLAGDQVTSVDRFGRPTHLTYTTDVNVSSGIAVESISQGTITIRYHSAGHASRGIFSQGIATMVVRGQIYSLGASQNLRNANINA